MSGSLFYRQTSCSCDYYRYGKDLNGDKGVEVQAELPLEKYLDVDDTLVCTTYDLQGDITRVDHYLTPAPGAERFLRWSPWGNILVSCCEDGSELGRALQEKKLAKFGLLQYFAPEFGGAIHICGSPEEKKDRLRWLIGKSRVPRHRQAMVGDRPSAELGVGIELGIPTYRMMLLREGRPEAKYAREELAGPHTLVHNWRQLRKCLLGLSSGSTVCA